MKLPRLSKPKAASPVAPEDLEAIATGFSRTAAHYDAFATDHPHLTRLRELVYTHLAIRAEPSASILELNCGSGTDALHLVNLGFRVHATDIAEGMLARLAAKAVASETTDRLTWQRCAFYELDQIRGGPFDVVFSNLGGLNCIADLRAVTRQLPLVLKPGGLAIWVLMPKICLWELATVFAGQFRLAFRRMRPGGTRAHLEGQEFPVYYFSPSHAQRAFGEQFVVEELEGLAVFTPTAESKGLIRRWPRLYRTLVWLDDRLARRWPWHSCGDFYILTMRYIPEA